MNFFQEQYQALKQNWPKWSSKKKALVVYSLVVLPIWASMAFVSSVLVFFAVLIKQLSIRDAVEEFSDFGK